MTIFLLFLLGNSEAFHHRPQNTVVKVGESFELFCSLAWLEVDWYHTPLRVDGQWNHPKKISRGYNLTFSTYGNSSGRLNVSSAQPDHAGIYTCLVVTEQSTTANTSAVVAVIVGDPVCEIKNKATFLEMDKIDSRCVLSYLGPVNPVMRWTQVTSKGLKELNSTQSRSMSHTSSQLNALADRTMHQAHFQCETSFVLTSSVDSYPGMAANTPNYSYIWTSDSIRILYGPRNLAIQPSDGILNPNEQANCFADGFPAPTIQWINLKTNETIPGPILPVGEQLSGEGKPLFMCVAVNAETKQTENITVEFRIKDLEPPTTTKEHKELKDEAEFPLATVLISCFAASLLVIGGLVVYIVSRKIKKRNQEITRAKEFLANTKYNQKVPVFRVNQQNFPQIVARVQPLDNGDYLSPQLEFTTTTNSDYDEIPDVQALSIDNIVYFKEPSTKQLNVPSSSSPPLPALSRTSNYYLASECELGTKQGFYETLRKQ